MSAWSAAMRADLVLGPEHRGERRRQAGQLPGERVDRAVAGCRPLGEPGCQGRERDERRGVRLRRRDRALGAGAQVDDVAGSRGEVRVGRVRDRERDRALAPARRARTPTMSGDAPDWLMPMTSASSIRGSTP